MTNYGYKSYFGLFESYNISFFGDNVDQNDHMAPKKCLKMYQYNTIDYNVEFWKEKNLKKNKFLARIWQK